MSAVVIRQMQLDDVPMVHLLDCMSFPLPWSANSYRYEVENEGSRAWVAVYSLPTVHAPVRYYNPHNETVHEVVRYPGEQAILSMLILWLILDEAHIATLAVHPDFRRRGIARNILVAALKGAFREGARTALLEVRAGNIVAQKLYQSFDFQIAGRRPGYYRDNNEDALLMTMPDLSQMQELWRNDEF